MISGYCDEKFSSARELFEKILNQALKEEQLLPLKLKEKKSSIFGAGLTLKKKIQPGRKIQ